MAYFNDQQDQRTELGSVFNGVFTEAENSASVLMIKKIQSNLVEKRRKQMKQVRLLKTIKKVEKLTKLWHVSTPLYLSLSVT